MKLEKIKVLIVDDHPVFLEGLNTVLSLKDPDIMVVGTATNGQDALERQKELKPDVILLDIKMPVMDGVEVTRQLCRSCEDIKIIMLTTFDDRQLINDALRAGAIGYLLKDSKAEQIIEAIKHANQGNILLSGNLAFKLSGAAEAPVVSEQSGLVNELSEREISILRLLSVAKRNSEIGEELFISEKTVRNYISHIYEILGIHTRTQAALWALKNLP